MLSANKVLPATMKGILPRDAPTGRRQAFCDMDDLLLSHAALAAPRVFLPRLSPISLLNFNFNSIQLCKTGPQPPPAHDQPPNKQSSSSHRPPFSPIS